MKLAIITNYWKNSPGGGVRTYLTNLVNEFNNIDNLDVSVLFKIGEDNENYHIKANNIFFVLKSFLKLKMLNPDVVHSHGTWYCLLPGYIYKKVYGTRLIHTFHTQPSKKLHPIGKLFFQTLLNKCDYVTFVSKSLKEDNEKHGLRFKESAITYAGVNSKEVSTKQITDFCNNFNINPTSYVLLAQGFLSNEMKAKGAKILIASLRVMLSKNPNIVLVLTGQGVFSNEVKSFTKSVCLSENVIFTEHLSDPFVSLAICDIYTHISLAEGGVSLSLLEAMVMGKPILATNIGGIPEAIDDGINGFLIEPCENQIIEKIEYMMSNTNMAKNIGNNAKHSALDKFTWEKTAGNFYRIYNK
jgi:glycosyltransferase involved in cell wall biosynthesis